MEPEGGRYLIRWAKILMRPSLLHIEQTCEALEQAIMGDTSEAVLPPEARMRGERSCVRACACTSTAMQRSTRAASPMTIWHEA